MALNAGLPAGKLPIQLLARLLRSAPLNDPRVRVGPGIGRDCAVIDMGASLLVVKSDPITFASDEIGWYAVQVNANDIATSGATPRWMLATVLLPAGKTSEADVERIYDGLAVACREIGVDLVGGHTEITLGIDHALIVGTMLGEVSLERLIVPENARPGDRLLLTKGVPVEATALLAREAGDYLEGLLSADELALAGDYLYEPGISVLAEAEIACSVGRPGAMHDPTEGGLVGAVWELSQATGLRARLALDMAPVPELAARVCAATGVDPYRAIASGALLIAAEAALADGIQAACGEHGIVCAEIGWLEGGEPEVVDLEGEAIPAPARDEVARFFEELQA